jgi:hypothetical protein
MKSGDAKAAAGSRQAVALKPGAMQKLVQQYALLIKWIGVNGRISAEQITEALEEWQTTAELLQRKLDEDDPQRKVFVSLPGNVLSLSLSLSLSLFASTNT